MTGWTTEKAVKEQTLKWIWIGRIVSLERTCVSEGAGTANMHRSGVSCRNRDDSRLYR